MALQQVVERVRERRLLKALLGQVVRSPTVTVSVLGLPTLTISVNKTTGYTGDTFNFSGKLTRADGTAVSGYTVTLYRDTTVAGTGTTDSSGNYKISWVANVAGSLYFHTEATVPAGS
jgi:hypothetical protein